MGNVVKKITKELADKLPPEQTRYEVTDTLIPGFKLRVTPTGIKTFALLYRNANGGRSRYTIGKYGRELTVTQARKIAADKLVEVKSGEDPQAQKIQQRKQHEIQKVLTLQGFIEHKFEPWAVANRKTGDHMVKRIKSSFADLLDKPLPEITPWIIEKWRKAKFKRGRKPGTINRDIATLKSCLSRAVEWGVIDEHPLRRLKLSKEDKSGIVRYLTPEEESRLRDALVGRDGANRKSRESGNEWRKARGKPELSSFAQKRFTDHLTPMVLLSMNTGMRRGEVFNLRWGDIDFSNESLVIHGHSAKSGTSRHIPLNSEALEALDDWKTEKHKAANLVFPGKNGKPFDNVKKGWEALMKTANIESFRWHDMRHHFASKLVMAGVDLNTVRELLGHSDFKLTLRYAHLAPEHKAAAVAKLMEGV